MKIFPVQAQTNQGHNSPITGDILNLLLIAVLIAVLLSILVLGMLVYMVLVFRESKGSLRKKIKNEFRLEVTWAFLAFIIVVFLFFASVPVIDKIYSVPAGDHEVVMIYGQQYNWTFVRENGITTWDVVYLNVSEIYIFNFTSYDVVHSFYCYELSFKVDVIPGEYTFIWVQINNPGIYEVHCAEFCGPGHYSMDAKIVVS
ncbi:MAG: cytochrome c oxidase subunit II transmembrane domain-containing protein [Candidatus Hodarchaeota archaeon]